MKATHQYSISKSCGGQVLLEDNHPSITEIKKRSNLNKTFAFNTVSVTKEDIKEEINNLDCSKAKQESDIPTKIVKENSDIFTDFISMNFNNLLLTCNFPDKLKLANVTPVHKKGSRTITENYRPVSTEYFYNTVKSRI